MLLEESLEFAYFDRLGRTPFLEKIPDSYYAQFYAMLPELLSATLRLEGIICDPPVAVHRGTHSVNDHDLEFFLEIRKR